MTSQESDSKNFDWTAVERAVEVELLGRAKLVARQIEERISQATGASDHGRRPGPNDPTDVCPVM